MLLGGVKYGLQRQQLFQHGPTRRSHLVEKGGRSLSLEHSMRSFALYMGEYNGRCYVRFSGRQLQTL